LGIPETNFVVMFVIKDDSTLIRNILISQRRSDKVKKNKSSIATTLGILGLIVGQFIIKSIGIDNMPVQVIATIFAIACIVIVAPLYKNRQKGFGVKHNTVIAILVVLTFIACGTGITLIKHYPIQVKNHAVLFLILFLGPFFSLAIYGTLAKMDFDRNK
jgi:multisubunit Na+/H+ antiporter MnhG subunit